MWSLLPIIFYLIYSYVFLLLLLSDCRSDGGVFFTYCNFTLSKQFLSTPLEIFDLIVSCLRVQIVLLALTVIKSLTTKIIKISSICIHNKVNEQWNLDITNLKGIGKNSCYRRTRQIEVCVIKVKITKVRVIKVLLHNIRLTELAAVGNSSYSCLLYTSRCV